MVAIRLLIFFLLGYCALIIIDVFFKSIGRTRGSRLEMQSDRELDLVLCPQCQSYVPKGEAVFSHGKYFCRDECVRLYQKTG